MEVKKKDEVIMRGIISKTDGLWDIPITTTPTLDNVMLPGGHPGMHQATFNRTKTKRDAVIVNNNINNITMIKQLKKEKLNAIIKKK